MKSEKGITLVEIIIAIFIISLFSSFLLFSFSGVQEEFRLTRAAHKLAQDLRKAQDLGLSGAEILDESGNKIKIAGYGVYFDTSVYPAGYLIYADSCPQKTDSSSPDYKYTGKNEVFDCLNGDTIVGDVVDIGLEEPGVVIKGFNNILGNQSTSIDFVPPNPITIIENLYPDTNSAEIILGLEGSSKIKIVSINKAGLIEIK